MEGREGRGGREGVRGREGLTLPLCPGLNSGQPTMTTTHTPTEVHVSVCLHCVPGQLAQSSYNTEVK